MITAMKGGSIDKTRPFASPVFWVTHVTTQGFGKPPAMHVSKDAAFFSIKNNALCVLLFFSIALHLHIMFHVALHLLNCLSPKMKRGPGRRKVKGTIELGGEDRGQEEEQEVTRTEEDRMEITR